ncbi:MAG: cupin domain-containing protein [Clostridiales bacterium]|nr:cupin domain-containing protein [Clostridiales bacterium]
MSVANREIAERLRAIRELSEISAEEIAKKIGMDATDYKKYESGEADIPVSILYDITNLLKVSMTELLTGGSAKLHTYSLVRKDRGIAVDRKKEYLYQNLAYSFSGRKIEPLLVTVPVSAEDEPLNNHPGHEFHYCLEGSYKIQIDKHILTINEGDSLYFDSHFPHGMNAVGDKPAKILVIVI